MSIGAIFIAIAMLILACVFVINPLLRAGSGEAGPEAINRIDKTGDRHNEVLAGLRDLDFDHQVGKISDEDYANLRANLLVQAAEALEQDDKEEAEINARLEEAIRIRRQKQPRSSVCSQCGSALDPADRFCRKCGKPVEMLCPKCGEKLQPGDLFCNSCGVALSSLKIPSAVEGSS